PDFRAGIRFDPVPDAALDAARRLEMGSVVKIVLRFREAFWERGAGEVAAEDGAPYRRIKFIITDQALPTWWTMLPVRAPVLVGWAGGQAAQRLEAASLDERVERAVVSLAQALGVDRRAVESRLEAWHHHNWSADPFARGSYSYVPVGGEDARGALAQPVADTLFFAGEALAEGAEIGTVHGAMASGRAAARRIVEGVRRCGLRRAAWRADRGACLELAAPVRDEQQPSAARREDANGGRGRSRLRSGTRVRPRTRPVLALVARTRAHGHARPRARVRASPIRADPHIPDRISSRLPVKIGMSTRLRWRSKPMSAGDSTSPTATMVCPGMTW